MSQKRYPVPCASDPIRIARTILTGDISAARDLAFRMGRMSFTSAECRAVTGACKEANRRWGSDLFMEEFLWPELSSTSGVRSDSLSCTP